MTFTDTGPGQLKVTCNGGCGAQLEQTVENKGTNLLDFMRAAGWAVGANLCPDCRGKDPWNHVVEQKPGVWVPKPPPKPRVMMGYGLPPVPPAAKRRRKIRRLL